MIEVAALRVAYGRTIALRDVDLAIRPGVTGLFGQNGAGKSTLLRAIAGLLEPTSGTISLDGRSLSLRDEEARRRLGYAGHRPGLYERLTVIENLRLFGRMYGVTQQRIDETLQLVDLVDRRDDRVSDLSAGLLRRAAVARAILHEPQVLLLDEPYANLDDEAAEAVSETVKAWRGDDRYALIATHGAKRVKPFADAGIILKRGQVISYRVRTEEGAGV